MQAPENVIATVIPQVKERQGQRNRESTLMCLIYNKKPENLA